MIDAGLRIAAPEITLFEWIFTANRARLMGRCAGKKGIAYADMKTEDQAHKKQDLPHTHPQREMKCEKF